MRPLTAAELVPRDAWPQVRDQRVLEALAAARLRRVDLPEGRLRFVDRGALWWELMELLVVDQLDREEERAHELAVIARDTPEAGVALARWVGAGAPPRLRGVNGRLTEPAVRSAQGGVLTLWYPLGERPAAVVGAQGEVVLERETVEALCQDVAP